MTNKTSRIDIIGQNGGTGEHYSDCPVCGEGVLMDFAEWHDIKYKGSVRAILNRYSICSECESKVVNSEQSTFNKGQVIVARGIVDNQVKEK